MQIYKDIAGINSELFLKTREYIIKLIGEDSFEKYSKNITSYYSKEEGGLCYLRTKDDYLHIGWFRGVYINDKYDCLFGNDKTIRGQKVYKLDKETKESIKH